MIVVVVDLVAWRLIFTKQFQVIGLLLSIQQDCTLRIAAPFSFLWKLVLVPPLYKFTMPVLEAPFLAHTRISSSAWQFLLLLCVPLGLSAGYKRFAGDSARLPRDPQAMFDTPSYYDMFAPPGLNPLVHAIGPYVFVNTICLSQKLPIRYLVKENFDSLLIRLKQNAE